ncbi:MAG: peroxiredoxin, partial [Bacteroidia bacterium]
KTAKKAAKKSAPKKAAKKTVKKAAKKVVKAAKKGAAKAKKAVKKVAKKAVKKATRPAPKKKASKPAKVSAKRNAPKPAVKKVVKKTVKRPAKKVNTNKSVLGTIGGFVKSAVETVVEKMTPHHDDTNINTHIDDTTSADNSNTSDSNTEEKTEESSEDKSDSDRFRPHNTSLHEGMMAPYFEGRDQNGNIVRSNDFIGKTLVLYFYPKDFTEGCTAEACSLRDEYQYLGDKNYAVVGVSADDVSSHKKFSDEYNLPFPIIADVDKRIISSYDVWGPKQLAGRIYDGIVRTTFIIDTDGIIKNIITKVDNANAAQQILAL